MAFWSELRCLINETVKVHVILYPLPFYLEYFDGIDSSMRLVTFEEHLNEDFIYSRMFLPAEYR